MSTGSLEARLAERVTARTPAVTALRRDLHRHPEIAFREERTSRVVAERLRALGMDVRADLAPTGVAALLTGARPGRTIALRADMDALPVREQTDLPYRSEEAGVMHACGHDGHIAILVGAAEALASLRADLAGSVKFIFQPAEEPVTGARAFLDAGVMHHPEVEAIVALHGWPGIPVGAIDVSPGPVMASADTFDITISGRGGHGAMPHLAVDPVVAAAQVVTTLQSIASRELSPLTPVVLSVTSLQAGETYNVIPSSAHLKGTVRVLDPAVRAEMPERICRIVAGVCAAYQTTGQVDFHEGVPVTVNDARVCAAIREAAAPLLGAENVRAEGQPSLAAEDFSLYAQRVPGALLRLGLGDIPSLHHPGFDFNDAALPVGVELFGRIALRLLRG